MRTLLFQITKFSMEQISLATKKSVDEVKRIIEEHETVSV